MLSLYRICGFLYLVSGVWCALQLELASGFLGFVLETELAKSEFFSVYGGLQIGLGLSMLITSLQPRYLEASLFYSAIFSSTLAVFRMLSFLVFGVVQALLMLLIIELLIACVLCFGWYRSKHRALHHH